MFTATVQFAFHVRRVIGGAIAAYLTVSLCASKLAVAQLVGFGSVPITFQTPAGYQAGFRDYLNQIASGAATGSPVIYVGNYGATGTGGDPIFRRSDDLNTNGISGAIYVVDPSTGGVIAVVTDFSGSAALNTFNIAFDRIAASQMPNSGAVDVINAVWLGADEEADAVEGSLAGWQAAEALRISDWGVTGYDRGLRPAESRRHADDPNPAPTSTSGPIHQRRNGIGLLYGMRMIEREYTQSMLMTGGILGQTRSEIVADNHVMGPALGLVWIKSRGPFTVRLQGIVSVGFNSGEVDQDNTVGVELAPSAVNRPLYSHPTGSSHHDSHDEFSPSGELRAEANLRITDNITFAINWSGIAIDNALEVDDRTRFHLPDFGLVDPGNQRLLVHNFFCGIEMVR